MVIDDTGSVEDIHAFIHCKKWRSGQVLPMPDRLTLKDRATELLIKYKSGALVTQFKSFHVRVPLESEQFWRIMSAWCVYRW